MRFFLELPFADEPDKKFIYNTAGTHALSALLGRTSGMTTLEFADRYLFAPTGMEISRWDRSPEGNYIGGAELVIVVTSQISGSAAERNAHYLRCFDLVDNYITPAVGVVESG